MGGSKMGGSKVEPRRWSRGIRSTGLVPRSTGLVPRSSKHVVYTTRGREACYGVRGTRITRSIPPTPKIRGKEVRKCMASLTRTTSP